MAEEEEDGKSGEKSPKKRVVCEVAEGPVYGLRPGLEGRGDEILVEEDGKMEWVPEHSRPDLAAATWQLQRRVLERVGKTRRGAGACRCMGCMSPICGRCPARICGGTGEKARCKNHWCEFPRLVGGKREKGRGKLRREIEGTLPAMSGKGGGIIVNHVCIGLCKATLGSDERKGPCPELLAEELVMPEECKCKRRVAANLQEQRRHQRECASSAGERANGWEEEVIQDTRNRIAGDAQQRRCIVPSCHETVVGIRGLYQHLVNKHWDDLPPNRRLAAAAHAALWDGWRASGRKIEGSSATRLHEAYPEVRKWLC